MIFTTQQKLDAVEHWIEMLRPFRSKHGTVEHQTLVMLKAIAVDLRAALADAGPTAMVSLQHRIEMAQRQKARIGFYEIGTLQGIGEEVLGRWPVIRRALRAMEETA